MNKKFGYLRKPKIVEMTCFKCNRKFNSDFSDTYLRRKRRTKNNFCSVKCKLSIQKLGGELSTSWKGGRRQYPSQNGYVMMNIGPNKRMHEHRYVMEKHLNRKLIKGEVVHHINGITSDNRVENLVVCKSAGEHHAKYHSKSRRRDGTYMKNTGRNFGKQRD